MEEEKKISFFKRIKIAIFNLENYKIFVNERFSKAVKYIFSLIAIVTIILSISTTISFRQRFDKLVSYVENSFPEFSYENEELSVDQPVHAYDEEYEAKLIVDTGDVTDEQLEAYREEASEGYYSLILLKDRAVYTISGYEYQATYSDFFNSLGIESFSKAEIFENYLNNDGITKVTIVMFIYAIIYLFVSNILVMIEDILIIAIFGWICSKICKVSLDFVSNCKLSAYSVTLSLILSTVYSIVNTFTNFQIKYFSLMYMIIAYIYIIAAIMIIKSDPNRAVGQEVPVGLSNEKNNEEIEDEKLEDKKDKEEEQKEKNQATEEKKNKGKKKSKEESKKELEGDSLPNGE